MSLKIYSNERNGSYGAILRAEDQTDNSLMHYRTGGEKKGVRRWQNKDGSYTPEGRQHYADMYGWGKERKNQEPKTDTEQKKKLAGTETNNDKPIGNKRSGTEPNGDRADRSGHSKPSAKSSAYRRAEHEVQELGAKAKDKAHNAIIDATMAGGGAALLQSAYTVMKYNEASGLRQTLIGLQSGLLTKGQTLSTVANQVRGAVNYAGDFLKNGFDMIGKIAGGTAATSVLAGSQANALSILGTVGVAALGAGVVTSAAIAAYCGIRYAMKKRNLKKTKNAKLSHADESNDAEILDALSDEMKLALLMVIDEIIAQAA